MNSVLFVCAANICRSPLAMGLLQARMSSELELWRIESAGVWAQAGYPPAENTKLILQKKGIDISGHRSRQITRDILSEFNLILTMEHGQKEALRLAFPEHASKVCSLSEMIGDTSDVADPIGGPLIDFEFTAREIDRFLTEGEQKIRILSLDSGIPLANGK